MKNAGNISLCIAALLLIYPLVPNLPDLRRKIVRSNNGLVGVIYAFFFWLMPRFLRLALATLTLWGMLMVAMVASIQNDGLEWLGLGWLAQGVLVGAACLAMASISVLIGFSTGDLQEEIPAMVRAIAPWAAWAFPLVVLSFCLFTINPNLAASFSSWWFRVPLLAAFGLALPMGAVLFVRWITPPAPVATAVR